MLWRPATDRFPARPGFRRYRTHPPHISPDDRWIAFVASDYQNPTSIYISPFLNGPGPGGWIPVTDGKAWDDKPHWLDDSSLIYYSNRDGFGCVWKQKLLPDTKRPAGEPSAVHHFHNLGQSPSITTLSVKDSANGPLRLRSTRRRPST